MQKKEKILNIIKIIYLALILIFVIGFFLIFIIRHSWYIYMLIGFFVVIISLYLTIHIMRSKMYIYTCPNCNHHFSISVLKDITSYNSGIGTKVLVCPNCGTKEVMKAKLKN